MKKILLSLMVAMISSMTFAQRNQAPKNCLQHFAQSITPNEVALIKTERFAKIYKLNSKQKVKLLELNKSTEKELASIHPMNKRKKSYKRSKENFNKENKCPNNEKNDSKIKSKEHNKKMITKNHEVVMNKIKGIKDNYKKEMKNILSSEQYDKYETVCQVLEQGKKFRSRANENPVKK